MLNPRKRSNVEEGNRGIVTMYTAREVVADYLQLRLHLTDAIDGSGGLRTEDVLSVIRTIRGFPYYTNNVEDLLGGERTIMSTIGAAKFHQFVTEGVFFLESHLSTINIEAIDLIYRAVVSSYISARNVPSDMTSGYRITKSSAEELSAQETKVADFFNKYPRFYFYLILSQTYLRIDVDELSGETT